jgi:hypothetical protein
VSDGNRNGERNMGTRKRKPKVGTIYALKMRAELLAGMETRITERAEIFRKERIRVEKQLAKELGALVENVRKSLVKI